MEMVSQSSCTVIFQYEYSSIIFVMNHEHGQKKIYLIILLIFFYQKKIFLIFLILVDLGSYMVFLSKNFYQKNLFFLSIKKSKFYFLKFS